MGIRVISAYALLLLRFYFCYFELGHLALFLVLWVFAIYFSRLLYFLSLPIYVFSFLRSAHPGLT